MLYIRFLNLQNPLQDVEQLYKDGTIKQGDIVCQQYTDKYSHLFMNGTWVKTLYNSKIKQNNEIEDDIEFLSTAIGNNSTNIDEISTRLNDTSTRLNNVSTRLDNTSNNLNDTSIRLNDVSTRLKDDYVNKTQYLKDEELIASTFADLNNKINNFDITKQLEPIYSNISNLNSSVQNVSDVLYTLTETENINHTIDTFKEVEKFLNNISDSSTLTELLIKTKEETIDGISEYYYNIEEMDGKIGDINTSINNTSSRIKELEKLYSNGQIDSFIGNLNTSIKDTSDNLNIVSGKVDEVSTRLDNTSVRLLNYLTINQYLKDEELIASTFADLNNKINNVGNIDFSNYYNIDQINEKISNINTSTNDISNNLSNTSIRLNNVSTRLNNLYTNTQIDTFISNLNTSIKDTSDNLNIVSGKVNEVSTRLNDTSVRLLNYLTINQYLEDEELIASTFADINNKINDQTELLDNNSTNITDISTNISNISTNIADISTNLSDNYLTKTQYLKDEKLIASTFADVNNKINSLYAEIAELKEQLKSSTK